MRYGQGRRDGRDKGGETGQGRQRGTRQAGDKREGTVVRGRATGVVETGRFQGT